MVAVSQGQSTPRKIKAPVLSARSTHASIASFRPPPTEGEADRPRSYCTCPTTPSTRPTFTPYIPSPPAKRSRGCSPSRNGVETSAFPSLVLHIPVLALHCGATHKRVVLVPVSGSTYQGMNPALHEATSLIHDWIYMTCTGIVPADCTSLPHGNRPYLCGLTHKNHGGRTWETMARMSPTRLGTASAAATFKTCPPEKDVPQSATREPSMVSERLGPRT